MLQIQLPTSYADPVENVYTLMLFADMNKAIY